MRYCNESRFVVRNGTASTADGSKGGSARKNCGDRNSHVPFVSDTSSRAPLAHSFESSCSSERTKASPPGCALSKRRRTISRLLRDASFTVVSILCRNPISQIQKNPINDSPTTPQYSSVRRKRIGRFSRRPLLQSSSRHRDESQSVWPGTDRQFCAAAGE
jgi:hypothetical protein